MDDLKRLRDRFEAILKRLADSGVKWPINLFRAYGSKTE